MTVSLTRKVSETTTATFAFDLSGKCLQVALERVDGGELQAGDFRASWNALLNDARGDLRHELFLIVDRLDGALADMGIDAAVADHPAALAVRRIDDFLAEETPKLRTRRGASYLDEDFYLQVASVYAAAVAVGDPAPTKRVSLWARAHGQPGASTNRAAQWVRRCRPDGFGLLTDPPGPRQSGGILTPVAERRLRRRDAER
jgi:hypothetical protein